MSNQIGPSNDPLAPIDPLAQAAAVGDDNGSSTSARGQFQGRAVYVNQNSLAVAEEMADDADVIDAIVDDNEELHEEIHKLSERRGADDDLESVGEDKKDDAVAPDETGLAEKGYAKALATDERFVSFLAKLRERDPKSEDDVLDEVKKHFADVTDQHQALEEAQKQLSDTGETSGLADTVRKARDTLYQQEGPAIRAGLNISTEIEEYARTGLANLDELREFYRKSVLKFENVADLFAQIVKLYGKDKFKEALTFLIKAGGSDMASQGPSVSIAQLKSVTDQLYDVEVLGNLLRNLDELLEHMKKLFEEGDEKASFEVMSRILDLTQARWIAPESIHKLGATARVGGVESLIYFFTSLKEIIRLIPFKIYPNNENRGKLIDATQEVLDQAVERDA